MDIIPATPGFPPFYLDFVDFSFSNSISSVLGEDDCHFFHFQLWTLVSTHNIWNAHSESECVVGQIGKHAHNITKSNRDRTAKKPCSVGTWLLDLPPQQTVTFVATRSLWTWLIRGKRCQTSAERMQCCSTRHTWSSKNLLIIWSWFATPFHFLSIVSNDLFPFSSSIHNIPVEKIGRHARNIAISNSGIALPSIHAVWHHWKGKKCYPTSDDLILIFSHFYRLTSFQDISFYKISP